MGCVAMPHRLQDHHDDERRKAERRGCLAPALAVQLAPSRRFRCIVKDISETGCRLVGVDLDTVHSPFLLSAEGWQGPRECDVRWRERKTIGVRFSVPHTGPDETSA